MSADNVIYVQRQEDGRYAIWHQGMSEWAKVPEYPSYQSTLELAIAYADGWVRGEMVVEYGVQVLPSKLIRSPVATAIPIVYVSDFLERKCTCVKVVVDKDGNFIPYECTCTSDSGK